MSSKMICRVCAKVFPPEVKLENFEPVSDIYFRLICLQPPDADLPEGACRDCCDKLFQFDNFRTMCLEAYEQLSQKAQWLIVELNNIKREEEYEIALEAEPLPALNPVEVEDVKVDIKKETHHDATDSTDSSDYEESSDDDYSDEQDAEQSEASEPKSEKSRAASKTTKAKKSKDAKSSKINCDQCEKFFYNAQRYQAHKRVHQGLKPAICEICSKEFAKFTYLKVHMRLAHTEDKERIMCDVPDCGRSFVTLAGMVAHKKVKHLGKQTPKKEHVCEYCGKVFASVSMMKVHRDKHEGIKNHTCSICGKAHDSKHKLKFHMLRHEGIKQYTCHICGAKKTTPTELKVHVNRHTKEKKYPCGQCDAVFLSTGNKSRHVRLVHQGIKKYKCTYCDRAFGKAETLKHHVMIHTGEKPHECQQCGKRFIQLVALQTHTKTHNKNSREADN